MTDHWKNALKRREVHCQDWQASDWLRSRCFRFQYDLPSTEGTLADRQLGPSLLPVLTCEPLAYPSLLIGATLLADPWRSQRPGQRGSC